MVSIVQGCTAPMIQGADRGMRRAALVRWLRTSLVALIVLAIPDVVMAREWRFSVYLDDDPIGTHRFVLSEQGDDRTLSSEAHFSVKFLSFEVYRYEHQAREVWRGDCLDRITARTDDNGTVTEVDGRAEGTGMRLRRTGGSEMVSGCLHSFAYWNPRLLAVPRLINPQDGVLADASLAFVGNETIKVRGQNVPARRQQLKTAKLVIDLWHDAAGEWLALESTTASGRKVRYRLE
jgi:hypothetical protein